MKRIWYCGCPFVCNYTLTRIPLSQAELEAGGDPDNLVGAFHISIEFHSDPVFDTEFLGPDMPHPEGIELPGYSDKKLEFVEDGSYMFEDEDSFILKQAEDAACEYLLTLERKIGMDGETKVILYDTVGLGCRCLYLPMDEELLSRVGKSGGGLDEDLITGITIIIHTKLWTKEGFATMQKFSCDFLAYAGHVPVGCAIDAEEFVRRSLYRRLNAGV